MSKIALEGNASGTGTFTVAAPNSNSNYTLTLPTETGTVLTNSGNQTGTFAALTVNGNNISADNSLGFRNRIINGAMVIDQRNAGASVTPASGDYTLDRFQAFSSASSKYSVQRSTTAPSGFINSLLVTSLAATSLAAGDYYMIEHKIEGLNVADLAWGTASAKTVTLSFQVYSSLTGTFGGAILNSASNRSYPFTYSVASANTWTSVSVTIPGDTSGTWLTTNGVGLYISFSLGMGSTYSGTAGAWAGAQYWSATGAVSVVGTNGATFYITGVQLEVGSVATPFERRDYGRELMLCQRYYFHASAISGNFTYLMTAHNITSTQSYGSYFLPVRLRGNPTLTTNGTASHYGSYQGGSQLTCSAVPAIDIANPQTPFLVWTYSSGLTVAGTTICRMTDSSAYLGFSAEL